MSKAKSSRTIKLPYQKELISFAATLSIILFASIYIIFSSVDAIYQWFSIGCIIVSCLLILVLYVAKKITLSFITPLQPLLTHLRKSDLEAGVAKQIPLVPTSNYKVHIKPMLHVINTLVHTLNQKQRDNALLHKDYAQNQEKI